MNRNIYTLILLFFTTFSFSQQSELLENVNYRAKELNQSLSKNGDSLILEGERTIYKVEIFNSDFEKIVNVLDYRAKIALHDIPLGRYIIDATLYDKHIIMTLLRNEEFDEKPKELEPTTEVVTSINSDKQRPVFVDKHASLLSKRPRKEKPKSDSYYWVSYKINNGNTGHKSMKLVNQEVADKLILRNQLEIKTLNGKHNELTIWEVYDRTAFIKKQFNDPNYINALNSDLFNVSPYFSSEVNVK